MRPQRGIRSPRETLGSRRRCRLVPDSQVGDSVTGFPLGGTHSRVRTDPREPLLTPRCPTQKTGTRGHAMSRAPSILLPSLLLAGCGDQQDSRPTNSGPTAVAREAVGTPSQVASVTGAAPEDSK